MAFPHDGKKFASGTSGNPGGRPKNRSCTADLRRILDEEAPIKGRPPGHGITKREVLMRRIVDNAFRTGDVALYRLILDRNDGKPPESIDLEERIAALEDTDGKPASPGEATRSDPAVGPDGTA